MSSAICAGCLEPIPKSGTDSKFVLSGTEVFHSRCAGLIGRSVLTRYRVKINDLKGKLANGSIAAAEAARLRTRVSDLERCIGDDAARYNKLYGEMRRLEREHGEMSARVNSYGTFASTADANLASAIRDRDEARRELAEAKAELARIRGVPSAEGSTKDANFPDDLSIRAGLLEID